MYFKAPLLALVAAAAVAACGGDAGGGTGHGASINTRTPEGQLVFGIFAALAEFERALISERTKVGLASARARGRNGGGQYKMTPAQIAPGHGGHGAKGNSRERPMQGVGGHAANPLPASWA